MLSLYTKPPFTPYLKKDPHSQNLKTYRKKKKQKKRKNKTKINKNDLTRWIIEILLLLLRIVHAARRDTRLHPGSTGSMRGRDRYFPVAGRQSVQGRGCGYHGLVQRRRLLGPLSVMFLRRLRGNSSNGLVSSIAVSTMPYLSSLPIIHLIMRPSSFQLPLLSLPIQDRNTLNSN